VRAGGGVHGEGLRRRGAKCFDGSACCRRST
jgi:hypothetical protein